MSDFNNLIISTTLRQKFPFLKQVLKYGVSGLLNTLIDFLVYFCLTRLSAWFATYYLIANSIAFVVSVTQSYYLNKYWVFNNLNEQQALNEYLRFFLVNLLSLAAASWVFYLLIEKLLVYDLIAKAVLIATYVVINFTLFKFWVFKKHEST